MPYRFFRSWAKAGGGWKQRVCPFAEVILSRPLASCSSLCGCCRARFSSASGVCSRACSVWASSRALARAVARAISCQLLISWFSTGAEIAGGTWGTEAVSGEVDVVERDLGRIGVATVVGVDGISGAMRNSSRGRGSGGGAERSGGSQLNTATCNRVTATMKGNSGGWRGASWNTAAIWRSLSLWRCPPVCRGCVVLEDQQSLQCGDVVA